MSAGAVLADGWGTGPGGRARGAAAAGAACLLALLSACANLGGSPGDPPGSGGAGTPTPASGGATAGSGRGGGSVSGSGGAPSVGSGGSAVASGGVTGSGGLNATSGGATGSGGSSVTGGQSGSGGRPGSSGGTIGSSGGAPGTAGASGRVDLKGKKVLFIVDDPASLSEGDMMLKDIMAVSKDMVVTMGDTTTANAAAATMNVIVASSGASASEFPALYKAATVPMIVFSNGPYQALGFIAASAGKGSVSTPVMLSIVDAATPLAAALPTGTPFEAIGTARSTSVYWGTPAGAPIKVASVASMPTQLIAFAYEKGAAMAVGTAPARRVALGFKTDVIGDLSIESFKLMIAALEWTAGAPP